MKKSNFVSKKITAYFNENLNFRVQIFNTLGFLGFALGIIFGFVQLIIQPEPLNILANFGASSIAAVVIWRANSTGNFKRYFLFTVIVVFMLIFPVLFFVSGGYTSSMPSFFVFAVAFTIIMLESKLRMIFTVLEIILYLGCFLTAYFIPKTVLPFSTETDMAMDIIFGSLSAAIVLAIAIYQHIIVYDRKQKELEKANEKLQGLDHIKTEFLQDIKHEIKNPLHVISLGADFIHNRISSESGTEEAHNALNVMQNEAIRLGRMINGMVELATMSDNPKNREKVNFTDLLRQCAEAYRLQIEQEQNTLRVDIAPDLPYVYAESEQLERIPVNLLSNAANSTQNGEITLEAFRENDYITVRISDTGEGIPPELLHRVFERGVSGKGGKGYGLSICKTIVEAHGGEIKIKSEIGRGTTAAFTIPVYGGQSEGRKHE